MWSMFVNLSLLGLPIIAIEKETVTLRSRIHIILPIALSIVLPGLSFYANPKLIESAGYGIYTSWLMVSFFIYNMWYLLWYLWDVKTKSKERWFRLLLAVVTVSTMLCFFFIFYKNGSELRWVNMVRITLLGILFFSIQYALKTQQNISRLLLEKEQIQTENYKAQLKALRAQIDPHFLFNSLNTLRSMVRHHHANSEKFIMSLSDFYRQTLKHNENTTLPLSEELTVLQSYLFLMKSRNEEAVSFQLRIDQELYPFHLPSMALQIVVENCFKHNSMTSKKPLCIEISNTNDNFIMVTNNIQPKIGEKDSLGYGLNLLKKRYELMNIKPGIIILQTPDQFSVKLKLFKK